MTAPSGFTPPDLTRPAGVTALPVEWARKFEPRGEPRPMLSRDADSMYWMSRYVERAEHVARMLMVTTHLLIDVGDLEPGVLRRLWQTVLDVVRDNRFDPPSLQASGQAHPGPPALAEAISRYVTFDAANPSSIVSCLTRARENALAIRESLSAEMWEALNELYWSIRADDAPQRFDENRDQFYRSILTGSMLFQGLTNQTLPRDQRWQFAQVAKYCERVDATARILQTRWRVLTDEQVSLETPIRNIHWMGVLRCCCSIEAYRREHGGDMDALAVVEFLLLRDDFPRSIRFCVDQARQALAAIRASTTRRVDPAERILGRLDAQLDYAELGEILRVGVPAYLDDIQQQVADATTAVQKAYFLY